MCSISRDPLRDECTICTAVAPDPVFTVRRYGDIPLLYGPGLVRKFSHPDPRNRRSANCSSPEPRNVSQVRVFVDEAAEDGPALDPLLSEVCDGVIGPGWAELAASVGSSSVVVPDVLRQ